MPYPVSPEERLKFAETEASKWYQTATALEIERRELERKYDAVVVEHDRLQKNCTALIQMFELMSSIPAMNDEQLQELVNNGKKALAMIKEKAAIDQAQIE